MASRRRIFTESGYIIKNFKPDVVHIHMVVQNVLVQPFRLFGLKTVTTIHNEFDRSVFLMRFASRILSVSKHGAEAMHRRGFPLSKIRVVVNGPVNSPRLPRAFEPVSLQHPALVTVCGMHHRKGIADLLHAFKLVLADHPKTYLYLVGEGPSRAEYESVAANLGLGGRAVFVGHLIDPRPYMFAPIFLYWRRTSILPPWSSPRPDMPGVRLSQYQSMGSLKCWIMVFRGSLCPHNSQRFWRERSNSCCRTRHK